MTCVLCGDPAEGPVCRGEECLARWEEQRRAVVRQAIRTPEPGPDDERGE